MTLQQATTYARRWLVATAAFLTLFVLVETFWKPSALVSTALYVLPYLCVARFVRWRGWIAGWKQRDEELTRVLRQNGISYGKVTWDDMQAELRRQEEDR